MEKLSFSRDSQIRKGWEYKRVYDQGTRVYGKGFTLIYRANGQQRSRIGISVSRKVRGSVRRNRIKRIIRESFRLYQKSYPEAADVVFAVRPDFDLSSPLAIRKAVERLVPEMKRDG